MKRPSGVPRSEWFSRRRNDRMRYEFGEPSEILATVRGCVVRRGDLSTTVTAVASFTLTTWGAP